MMAAVRLGAVHVLVFGGFAAKELSVRINDCKPKLVICFVVCFIFNLQQTEYDRYCKEPLLPLCYTFPGCSANQVLHFVRHR